jgi:hypothetical protein
MMAENDLQIVDVITFSLSIKKPLRGWRGLGDFVCEVQPTKVVDSCVGEFAKEG